MATVKRFEDLHAWQSAREFMKLVYRFTNQEKFIRDFALKDQIRRAASSILYIALDEEYITKVQFDDAYNRSTQILKQINSLIGYLDTSRKNSYRTTKEDQANYSIEIPDH